MVAMDEVESSPLMDAERAEDEVGDTASGTEEGFGLIEKRVDFLQMFRGGAG